MSTWVSLFETLVRPGILVMQRLRMTAKFAIISAAFLVSLAVAVYGVVSYSQGNIEFAAAERMGAAYIAPLNEVLCALGRAPKASRPTGAPWMR